MAIGFHEVSRAFLLSILKVASKLHSIPHDNFPSTMLSTLMEFTLIVVTIVLDETTITMSLPVMPISLIELALLQVKLYSVPFHAILFHIPLPFVMKIIFDDVVHHESRLELPFSSYVLCGTKIHVVAEKVTLFQFMWN